MAEVKVIINGETHVLTRDVGNGYYCGFNREEFCSLASVCKGVAVLCKTFINDGKFRHFEKQKQTQERKIINIKYSMEVDGKRHVLVKDPEGKNGFLSCKACSLRGICKVGELLCIDIMGDSRRDRYNYHFEQIDLPNDIKP